MPEELNEVSPEVVVETSEGTVEVPVEAVEEALEAVVTE